MLLRSFHFLILLAALFGAAAFSGTVFADKNSEQDNGWEIIKAKGEPTARHEAAFVAHKGKLYLIGGRRINPVDVFDPKSNRWTQKSKTPIELHHFQAVSHGDAIWIIGAMTGGWPTEKPVERIIKYYPDEDRFEYGPAIPEARRRGAAGIAVHNDKFYLVGGITNGHLNGYVPWLDEFDPATGQWRILPDAPQPRDHFQAVVAGGKLYAFAGRKSEYALGLGFEQTVEDGNVFDFAKEKWLERESRRVLTMRAGNMAIAFDDKILIGGGESGTQIAAHKEVDIYDPATRRWHHLPSLQQGRHGTGFARIGDWLYVASGTGKRGGEPELATIERANIPALLGAIRPIPIKPVSIPTGGPEQWHKVELSFRGPDTSEDASTNPFTDYRLLVTFTAPDGSRQTVRGFYAADGNAAESGADNGNIWRVRFTPDQTGRYRWVARLAKGRDIAIDPDPRAGEGIPLKRTVGSFFVRSSDRESADFRAPNRGLLLADKGYFRFAKSGKYWMKGGTNSPENFLGYYQFDGTYRISDNAREGEANAGSGLHQFTPHYRDWRKGDPEWQNGKGRSIIGAVNYLADQGMNSIYFLTLNILGDGKDVWPYRDPNDFTRFDVSKLDQWDIVFSHMQARGILLHIVLQETENELMLDGGDTGRLRKLYLAEMVARFGYHNALVWNLGEENGPVHWRPEGQNDAQRRAMTDYLKSIDPYSHPVLLHTHSEAKDKDHIAGPLLGFKLLDGLSFQVAERQTVNAETIKWRAKARQSGHDWLITMDEIGKWWEGAVPDFQNMGRHDSLRRHALWGHLLGGGAGVEWYFGAKYAANDLTSEDWRLRESLWKQTHVAMQFFEKHLAWWDMKPCNALVENGLGYCLVGPDKNGKQQYVFYHAANERVFFNFPEGKWNIHFFDPINGGKLIPAKPSKDLTPPDSNNDWVVLIRER